ncbi:glycoside hydrolase family 172 protein [Haloferula sp. BvORR071]|uniref:glycoside hydrolase family 172 protein n=1 Tax=Haloferula sp. BvORR071 TaxID=1396141 RepID=UPI0005524EEC|nr:glycoside hydrolase family 172 protein [Haloferula sp. BvORR071]
MKLLRFASAALILAGSVRAETAAPVTLASLIAEMTDYDSVARWPEPAYTCLQASSYDRRTVAADRDGWFANDDHTQFIRDEVTESRKERVMMDAEGPGCLVRFWLTTVKNKHGVIRIYLDGAAAPSLTFPAYDLMSGTLGLKEPMVIPHPGYTADGNGGNTLMLPIPYAEHCKVTWEEKGEGPRYYQINYRKYAAGTKVETFMTEKLEAARSAIEKAGKTLLSPPEPEGMPPEFTGGIETSSPLGVHGFQAGGVESSLDLPAGAAAVRQIRLRIKPDKGENPATLLRAMIVKISFDGEETVWCPASDFFGSGAGLNELQSWYRSVSADGWMTCRWVMPYARSGRITLLNAGRTPIMSELECILGPWTWDQRSMHFHTAWHYEGNLRTPPARDWNFIKLGGRGVYVGDTLSLYNEVPTWYGEGDEKIRLDGETLPSHLGTGTEDYYGYSFAPRGIMQTPFANQIRVDEPRTQGHNVLTRTRNLDSIPFTRSLDFDIELISWAPTRMIYAATTHWYAFPGGSSNRQPEVANATAPIPTLQDAQKPPAAFPGVVEAEGLRISSSTAGMVRETQDMQLFGIGMWSSGKQLLVRGTAEENQVTLELPAPDARPKKLIVGATRAADYATLSFTVNDKPAAVRFDGYAKSVSHSGDIELGTFTPVDGKFEIRVEVTGTNPATTGPRYYFGLDYFRLQE